MPGAVTRRTTLKACGALFGYTLLARGAWAVEVARIKADVVADLSIQTRDGSTVEIMRRDFVGSPGLWQNIGVTAERLVQLFELKNPTIAIVAYEDMPLPGYAAADGTLEGEARIHAGVLMIGDQMTSLLIERFKELSVADAVSGSLAHELAHLYQFRAPPGDRWWDRMLAAEGERSRRRAELHADFLAGWSLGRTNFVTDIDRFARRLYTLGDTDLNDPNHHGTPEQRYAAVVRGFFLGRNDKAALEDAASEGELFVNAIVSMRLEP